jgi:FkbM family methyltransferase
MMELGAFWAYYSLWMLDRIPDTRVILVEPDPNNLAVGQTNLALNDRHAEVFQAAVGSAAELPQPFVCESDRQTRLVPTESLPSLLERFATERIDVLLLDVQGAELAFLEGGREVLEEHVRFIMVSTHHHSISGDPAMHQRCLQLLIELGAHVIAEHTVAESFSGDGLIVASFDQRDAQLSVPISYARASESLFGDPLDDFARSTVDRARLRERLDAALGDVALANAELKRATAARDAATAATARAQAELTKVKATATWRLRQKLLRSWAGRAVLRAGSRAIRPLSGSDRTTTDGQKDRPAL